MAHQKGSPKRCSSKEEFGASSTETSPRRTTTTTTTPSSSHKQQQQTATRAGGRGGAGRGQQMRSSTQQQQQQQNKRNRYQRQHVRHRQQQYHRTREDRASARRKADQAMFYLHASADHAFVITRRCASSRKASTAGQQQQEQEEVSQLSSQQQYSYQGPDHSVSWESVRLVKQLVPATAAERDGNNVSCCPICLDDLACPRVTKCGHCFCLVCCLRHVQSCLVASKQPKCPCCSLPLRVEDLRPVLLVTTCGPTTTGSTTAAAAATMTFVKLHRVRSCPTPYLPLLTQPRRSSPYALPRQTDDDAPYSRFCCLDAVAHEAHLRYNLTELQQQQQQHPSSATTTTEAIALSMAVEMVQQELRAAQQEAAMEMELAHRFENPAAGFYVPQPAGLLALDLPPAAEHAKSSVPAVQSEDYTMSTAVWDEDDVKAIATDNVVDTQQQQQQQGGSHHAVADNAEGRDRAYSLGTELSGLNVLGDTTATATTIRRGRAHSVASSTTAASAASDMHSRDLLAPAGSMYVDENEETVFYQAQDGSLCFLSGFNMNCLRSEFSVSRPDEELVQQKLRQGRRRKLQPLPDTVTGKVLDVERVHLTPDLRQRYRFLSHLPVYSDICFVEISLGNVLSKETKKVFRKEFQKRKQARMNRLNAERREDERTRRKEEARINELKSRMQRIDPDDEFFHHSPVLPETVPTGDEFGPAISSSGGDSTTTTSPVRVQAAGVPEAGISFSQICRSGQDFPNAQSAPTDYNFPALGSTPPSRTAPPPPIWGRSPPKQDPTTAVEDKKKSPKGKNIVLFSTGSHRGGSY